MSVNNNKFNSLLEAMDGREPKTEPEFGIEFKDLEEAKSSMADRDKIKNILKKIVGANARHYSVTWWGDKWGASFLQGVSKKEAEQIKAAIKGKNIGGRTFDVRYDAGLKTVYID